MLAEQFGHLVAAHESVMQRRYATIDVAAARARIRAGRHAFDVSTVLRTVGDLTKPFGRVAAAFERTGVESSARITDFRSRPVNPSALMLSWASGDSLPRDPALRFARQVAAVVGNAVLAGAAEDVAKGISLAGWKRAQCPCCGAVPDLVIITDKRRAFGCWRCDTTWRTEHRGCLGCGEDTAPTVVRVASPTLGYELAVCNSCGRYTKERHGLPMHGLLVERALSAGLDEAAQQRGLRV
jgi:hypothetical protein